MESTLTTPELLRQYLAEAKGIAWDTCHKIYILMDDNQMEEMRGYGYDPLIPASAMTPKKMYTQVRKWYNESCSLRFIQAVRTSTTEDPNEGFFEIVGQFEKFYK